MGLWLHYTSRGIADTEALELGPETDLDDDRLTRVNPGSIGLLHELVNLGQR